MQVAAGPNLAAVGACHGYIRCFNGEQPRYPGSGWVGIIGDAYAGLGGVNARRNGPIIRARSCTRCGCRNYTLIGGPPVGAVFQLG